MCENITISQRSSKQTMVITSSNHYEILALHEASCECVWLRSLIHHIISNCKLSLDTYIPKVIHEDNDVCIEQIIGGYIKGDRTKYISPKYFYTHELQKSHEIVIQQIYSLDNLVDLFTKVLPSTSFKGLVQVIGMRRMSDQYGGLHQGDCLHHLCIVLFLLSQGFFPLGFLDMVLMRQL